MLIRFTRSSRPNLVTYSPSYLPRKGDCIELDGTYRIESVTHTYSFDGLDNGQERYTMTSVEISLSPLFSDNLREEV